MRERALDARTETGAFPSSLLMHRYHAAMNRTQPLSFVALCASGLL